MICPRLRSTLLRCFFASLVLAIAAPTIARAQGVTVSDRPLGDDPAVRSGRLPNGLTYYVRHNGYPARRAELRLVVNAGSILEDDDQRGLAHVLEHMAFDGSTNFPGHAIWDYLERVGMQGGADINASTSYEETVYKLTIPTDSAAIVENGLRILGDWAHGLVLDSAELERERKVVIEEWRLRRGAGARIGDRQLPLLLEGSRYPDRQPIGVVPVLESAPIERVRSFYRDWYRPDLMAVVVVGDVDADSMAARIRQLFGAIPPARDPRPRAVTVAPPRAGARVQVATDSEATATTLSLITTYPRRAARTVADFRRALVESMYNSLLGARLGEAAHRGDPPFLAAGVGSSELVRPLDAHQMQARVVDGGVQRGLAALRAEAARAARDGFTASELEREKTALLRSYDEVELRRDEIPSAHYAGQLVERFLRADPVPSLDEELALARELTPSVTLDEIHAAARGFASTTNLLLLVSAPASARSKLPSEKELLAALASEPPALAAYADSAAAAPLLANEPAPGKVVKAMRDDAVGVELWELSNGVRVLLKPTDLDPGQLLITSYRDGGMSVAPDSELVPAATALQVVSQGGLGSYDAVALRKRLAGIVVNVGGTIGGYGEGVWGSGSPKDATTLFQLVYMQFTAPRLDTTAFQRYRRQLRETLSHRSVSPEAAMSDTLALLLAAHSPRVRLLDEGFIGELDAQSSLRFFRSRFADANGFTFVIVGAFDPDSIRPLVERYIGGLPSSGARSRWRDVGVRPPEGITTRVIRKGKEPKASTTLVFLGESNGSHLERVTLSALANVVQQRLWERLRQRLGGVYGVTVSADQDVVPVPRYTVTVGFGADPERMGELVEAVFDEIGQLKNDGPTDAELGKFREEQRRGRETAMRTNAFWLSSISLYDQRGWPLDDILSPDERLDAVDASAIRDAARRYLDASHYVRVTLLPEG